MHVRAIPFSSARHVLAEFSHTSGKVPWCTPPNLQRSFAVLPVVSEHFSVAVSRSSICHQSGPFHVDTTTPRSAVDIDNSTGCYDIPSNRILSPDGFGWYAYEALGCVYSEVDAVDVLIVDEYVLRYLVDVDFSSDCLEVKHLRLMGVELV